MLKLDEVCSEECAQNTGEHFFDKENWWPIVRSPVSSCAPLALGASDIAMDLPVKKSSFSGFLPYVIEHAHSYYLARWLVPSGLARKEQFLPHVTEWLADATGEDIVNLALDGWIDFETTKQKLLELDSQNKLTESFRERLASSIPELSDTRVPS